MRQIMVMGKRLWADNDSFDNYEIIETESTDTGLLHTRLEQLKELLTALCDFNNEYDKKAFPLSDEIFIDFFGEGSYNSLVEMGYIKNNKVVSNPFADNWTDLDILVQELCRIYPEYKIKYLDDYLEITFE